MHLVQLMLVAGAADVGPGVVAVDADPLRDRDLGHAPPQPRINTPGRVFRHGAQQHHVPAGIEPVILSPLLDHEPARTGRMAVPACGGSSGAL